MAKTPAEISHPLRIALDDVCQRVHALIAIADAPLPLDRDTLARLMEAIETLEAINAALAEAPEEMWRKAHEDMLH